MLSLSEGFRQPHLSDELERLKEKTVEREGRAVARLAGKATTSKGRSGMSNTENFEGYINTNYIRIES